MYQLWYGKQCLGYCGTGLMLKRWGNHKKVDTSCPNCGKADEDAHHLNQCGSPDRRRLLAEHIVEIEEWMKGHCTHPELQQWLPIYLAHRGRRLFVDMDDSRSMSQEMRGEQETHRTNLGGDISRKEK